MQPKPGCTTPPPVPPAILVRRAVCSKYKPAPSGSFQSKLIEVKQELPERRLVTADVIGGTDQIDRARRSRLHDDRGTLRSGLVQRSERVVGLAGCVGDHRLTGLS